MKDKNITINNKSLNIEKTSGSLVKRGLLLANNLNSTSAGTDDKLQNHLNKIEKLYQIGEYEQIIGLAEEIIKIDRSNYMAWWYVSRSFWRQYFTEKALLAIIKTIRIKSDFSEAWLTKSAIHLDLEEYEEAFDSANQAIKADPNNYKAWNNRGLACERMKNYSEAKISFKKAIDINPEYHNGKSNLFSLNLNFQTDKPIEHGNYKETK